MSSGEEWRIAFSFPDYEVSSLGRVRRLTPKRGAVVGQIIGTGVGSDGYHRIIVRENGRKRSIRIHRLVCEAFHGPPPTKKHQTAHKDGSRTNNNSSNLYWATWAQNVEDRIEHYPELNRYVSDDGYKICSKCKTKKHVSDFPRNRSTPNGYAYHCSVCAKETNDKWILRKKLGLV